MLNRICEAKKYLSKNLKLEEIICTKKERLKNLRAQSVSINSVMGGGEKVQSSGKKDKMADLVCKIIVLEEEILKDIEELLDIKLELIGKLNNLSNESYKLLLSLRYIHNKTFHDISKIMKVSNRWIMKLHKKALEEFSDKFINS